MYPLCISIFVWFSNRACITHRKNARLLFFYYWTIISTNKPKVLNSTVKLGSNYTGRIRVKWSWNGAMVLIVQTFRASLLNRKRLWSKPWYHLKTAVYRKKYKRGALSTILITFTPYTELGFAFSALFVTSWHLSIGQLMDQVWPAVKISQRKSPWPIVRRRLI